MASKLRVFISSPRDLLTERQLVRDVLSELQSESIFAAVRLEAVSWDDPAAPVPTPATLPIQTSIDTFVARPRDCAVVVVMFWSRLGSPTMRLDEIGKPRGCPSGTVWELEDALAGADGSHGPPICTDLPEDTSPGRQIG